MVPCYYTVASSTGVRRWELHTFCDASKDAIGAVSYLRTVQHNGSIKVSFVFGKAKLVPSHATTIPHLELSVATLGIEIAELINHELDVKPDVVAYYSDSRVVLRYITNETQELDVKPDVVAYYSDSRVVLGYITNETQRFYVFFILLFKIYFIKHKQKKMLQQIKR